MALIKSFAFNQDYTCLAIGFKDSYKIYNCDPFGECFNKNDENGSKLIEMLFSTSLIAVVGLKTVTNSNKKLKIINTKRKTIICEITFPSKILNIKLNRKRLIVLLNSQIYIYDISCMKLLHTIELSNTGATIQNGEPMIALSSNDSSILAFPSMDNELINTTINDSNDNNDNEYNDNDLQNTETTQSSIQGNDNDDDDDDEENNGGAPDTEDSILSSPSPLLAPIDATPSTNTASINNNNLSENITNNLRTKLLSPTPPSDTHSHPNIHTHTKSDVGIGSVGTVILYDAINIHPINAIKAHKTQIQKISISKDGKYLATASIKGTIIRVFRVNDGVKIFEFRRGSYNAKICCLEFNLNNTILCCSSDTGTIHLFMLDKSNEIKKINNTTNNNHDHSNPNDPFSEPGSNQNEESVHDTTTNTAATDNSHSYAGDTIPSQLPIDEQESEELNSLFKLKNKISKTKFKNLGSNSISDYLWYNSSIITKNFKNKLNDYLPDSVTSIIEPKRNFAFIKLPNTFHFETELDTDDSNHNINNNGINSQFINTENGSVVSGSSLGNNNNANNNTNTHNKIESIVAINELNKTILVVTNDGNFYVYSLPQLDKGGECILLKQYKLYPE